MRKKTHENNSLEVMDLVSTDSISRIYTFSGFLNPETLVISKVTELGVIPCYFNAKEYATITLNEELQEDNHIKNRPRHFLIRIADYYNNRIVLEELKGCRQL